jgi:hypothetical protein
MPYDLREYTHTVMTEILKTNSEKIYNATVILLYMSGDAVINGQKHKK